MSKATVDQLGELHGLVCQWGVDKLNEFEPIQAMTPEGPVTVGYKRAAKANDISAITKFLNDNKVTADIRTNKGLTDLSNTLKKQKRHSDNVVKLPAAGEAASQIHGMKYASE